MQKPLSLLPWCILSFCFILSYDSFSQAIKQPAPKQKNSKQYIVPKVYAQKKTPEQFLKDQLGQKIVLSEKNVADQVIPDDLIVQSSICVGLDCVNNENFGFTTIRLKENNLRIGFDDTSTSVGFPSTDWELEANQSASGGTNSFAINDITGSKVPFKIIAGAPTNSFFMNDQGKIGLGTSIPVLDFNISNGNTPAIRLEQTNIGGFASQTWDMAGNEANFFIRDVTGGSRLPFRIRPGAPTSSLDISASGNVGINTASPKVSLQVGTFSDTARVPISKRYNAHIDGSVFIKDTLFVRGPFLPGSMITSPSDKKLKNNIIELYDATRIVRGLLPKTFYYDTDKYSAFGFPKGMQYGLIAQEVEKILPDFVTTSKFPGVSESFKTVNYVGLIPIVLQSLKEQVAVNDKQQEEIERLLKKLQVQESQLGKHDEEMAKLNAEIKKFESLNQRLEQMEAKLSNQSGSDKAGKDKK